ncbi:MAG TPA: IPT/TIG domain-containing protein [Cyclobacteriaceae bacterium]|nr:IPT/TIG domain-containing protein [Cyclobacteriaceae bacterium]HRJ83203.1 IPT/TIG domain-containing protein [Cyclobacteriaceae bacterium]
MKPKKIIFILFVCMAALSTTRCNNDEGITFSMKDVSARVTGFSNPKTGPGAELTITGSQLETVQRIFIGTERILKKDFVSQTESAITFNVPTTVGTHTDGTLTDVLVVFNGPERAFTKIEVVPLQAISSFTPYAAAPGETVTIMGVNFNLVTGVKLGDVSATITSQSPTLLKFTMPAGAATNRITLVGEAGSSRSANNLVACSGSPNSPDCATALNLNSGLELGTGDDFTNWGKWNGGSFQVATTVPGEYYRGSRALKVIRDGSLASGQWRIQFVSDPVATDIGSSYTVYVWARAAVAGAGFRVSLNPDTGFYPGDVAVTPQWQQFSFVVPGERIQNASTRFVLDLNGTNTAVTTFYIDDIKVIKN